MQIYTLCEGDHATHDLVPQGDSIAGRRIISFAQFSEGYCVANGSDGQLFIVQLNSHLVNKHRSETQLHEPLREIEKTNLSHIKYPADLKIGSSHAEIAQSLEVGNYIELRPEIPKFALTWLICTAFVSTCVTLSVLRPDGFSERLLYISLCLAPCCIGIDIVFKSNVWAIWLIAIGVQWGWCGGHFLTRQMSHHGPWVASYALWTFLAIHCNDSLDIAVLCSGVIYAVMSMIIQLCKKSVEIQFGIGFIFSIIAQIACIVVLANQIFRQVVIT